eukprot:334913-Prorocentrum_minimum.AAC.1
MGVGCSQAPRCVRSLTLPGAPSRVPLAEPAKKVRGVRRWVRRGSEGGQEGVVRLPRSLRRKSGGSADGSGGGQMG